MTTSHHHIFNIVPESHAYCISCIWNALFCSNSLTGSRKLSGLDNEIHSVQVSKGHARRGCSLFHQMPPCLGQAGGKGGGFPNAMRKKQHQNKRNSKYKTIMTTTKRHGENLAPKLAIEYSAHQISRQNGHYIPEHPLAVSAGPPTTVGYGSFAIRSVLFVATGRMQV